MAVAESLLATLVPGARVVLPFVESMVERGFTSAQITEGLREIRGEAIRRTDLLRLINAVKGVTSTRPYLEAVRDAFKPDPARLARPVTRTLRAFSFKVRITG